MFATYTGLATAASAAHAGEDSAPRTQAWADLCGLLLVGNSDLDREAGSFALREFSEIKHQITKDFPPDQFVYIQVGRSNAPLAGLLETDPRTAGSAATLPLTLRNLDWDETTPGELEPLLMGALRSVGAAEDLKQTVFVDFANTGESLVNLVRILNVSPHDRFRSASFVYLAPVEPPALRRNHALFTGRSVTRINVSGRLHELLMRGTFKPWAPHASYNFDFAEFQIERDGEIKPPPVRAPYEDLIELLRMGSRP